MSAKKEEMDRASTITFSMPLWMKQQVIAQAKRERRSASDFVKLVLIERLANIRHAPEQTEPPKKHDCPASGCGAKNASNAKTA